MIRPSQDPFEHDDAAYLLGLLPPERAAAFEAHRAGCAACAERVARLRPARDALALLDESDLAGMPDPAPLRPHDRRWRQRPYQLAAAMGGLAAAAVTALIVVLAGQGPSTPAAPAAGQAMIAVAASPMHADAAVVAQAWGTRIRVTCSYPDTAAYPGAEHTYLLQVVARDGSRHVLGSWTLRQGGHAVFTSGTALAKSEIRSVQITTVDGTPVLQLRE